MTWASPSPHPLSSSVTPLFAKFVFALSCRFAADVPAQVYSILFIQLLGSAVVGGLYRLDAVNQSFAGSPAFLISAMVLSFVRQSCRCSHSRANTLRQVNLGLVYWKRHSHPLNVSATSSPVRIRVHDVSVRSLFSSPPSPSARPSPSERQPRSTISSSFSKHSPSRPSSFWD